MHEISTHRGSGGVVPNAQAARQASRFETRVVVIPPDMSRSDARQMLADEAEYGQWEMKRVVLFRGGTRKVWLRRRIIKVRRTDAA